MDFSRIKSFSFIPPLQEGAFQLTGRVNVFFDNQSDVLTEELSLRFNEMYIFSN